MSFSAGSNGAEDRHSLSRSKDDAETSPMESRQERLTRIRAAIERGDYDTPEKFDAALERMFDTWTVP